MGKFAEKFSKMMKARGSLCVGLDPTPQILDQWGLPQTLDGLKSFCDVMTDVCTQETGIIKPQVAYYERFGPEGLGVMRDMAVYLKSKGNLIIYDAKRGDIGSTSGAYASGYFGDDSPFQADAITVIPTLGFNAIRPILDKASECGGGVFIVVRSSNPEGENLQEAICADGRSVAATLAQDIFLYNQDKLQDGMGPVGAVIGATLKNMDRFLSSMPSSFFLSPGIGFQGATFADLKESFGKASVRTIPSSSRGILMQGPDTNKLKDAIVQARQESLELLR